MENKKFWLVMLAIVLVLGLTGCDDLTQDNGGFTFEFRVKNNCSSFDPATITKIQFINGSAQDDPVLRTEEVSLYLEEMSSTYIVSGFTQGNEVNRSFGVIATFDSGYTVWGWGFGRNKSKIHANVGNVAIEFYY